MSADAAALSCVILVAAGVILWQLRGKLCDLEEAVKANKAASKVVVLERRK